MFDNAETKLRQIGTRLPDTPEIKGGDGYLPLSPGQFKFLQELAVLLEEGGRLVGSDTQYVAGILRYYIVNDILEKVNRINAVKANTKYKDSTLGRRVDEIISK